MTCRRRRYGLGAEDDADFFSWRRGQPCEIGHDVWVGHGAKVMAGVTIGTAVIGAGAVVTRDIEPYGVAVGAPARTIRTRFSEDVVRRPLA